MTFLLSDKRVMKRKETAKTILFIAFRAFFFESIDKDLSPELLMRLGETRSIIVRLLNNDAVNRFFFSLWSDVLDIFFVDVRDFHHLMKSLPLEERSLYIELYHAIVDHLPAHDGLHSEQDVEDILWYLIKGDYHKFRSKMKHSWKSFLDLLRSHEDEEFLVSSWLRVFDDLTHSLISDEVS